MTKRARPQEWRIVSSTSRFFPVQSFVYLTPKESSARVEVAVNWENVKTLPLFDVDFPKTTPSTFREKYDHPKENPKEHFLIVVTVCPEQGPGSPRFLCGQVYRLRAGADPGPTGVWVAEEERPKRPRRKSS